MVAETGVDGVVIGRGCLGRPWLFRDLADAFAGPSRRQALPTLGEVAADRPPARRAAGRPVRRARTAAPTCASTWPGTSRASRSAASCAAAWRWSPALAELDDLLGQLDPDVPVPADRARAYPAAGRARRGARSRCPRAGWTTPPAGTWIWSAPSWASRVADQVHPSGRRPGPRPWPGTRHREPGPGPRRLRRAASGPGPVVRRELREQRERRARCGRAPPWPTAPATGPEPEEPDDERTCFERDRDRIVHSTAFRRLAGKTQVVVYPTDHQRTRLTHALEVAQVATSIARAAGVNVTLADAIALGHDCGHGPGGHASEDAFDAFIPERLRPRPVGRRRGAHRAEPVRRDAGRDPQPLLVPARPGTVEGEIVSWADRIAYCAHDLEDAVHSGIVAAGRPAGRGGRGLRPDPARAAQHLRPGRGARRSTSTARSACRRTRPRRWPALRAFNYERIYVRPASLAQSRAVVDVLRALVEHYAAHPDAAAGRRRSRARQRRGGPGRGDYVAGMTDRYAFDRAVELLGWDPARLPRGISSAKKVNRGPAGHQVDRRAVVADRHRSPACRPSSRVSYASSANPAAANRARTSALRSSSSRPRDQIRVAPGAHSCGAGVDQSATGRRR